MTTGTNPDPKNQAVPQSYLLQILRVLPTALVLWVASRLFFDAVTRKPMFWSSNEAFVAFAWNGAFFVPIMVLVLIYVTTKYNSGSR